MKSIEKLLDKKRPTNEEKKLIAEFARANTHTVVGNWYITDLKVIEGMFGSDERIGIYELRELDRALEEMRKWFPDTKVSYQFLTENWGIMRQHSLFDGEKFILSDSQIEDGKEYQQILSANLLEPMKIDNVVTKYYWT